MSADPAPEPARATTPAPIPDAVTVRGASLTYPNGLQALLPAELALTAGEFLAIVGPSGCGKSSLLRLIAGLQAPSAGRVERAAGTRLAFVFQDPTLMPWANVQTNARLLLDLAGVERRQADERVRRQLGKVGLADFAGAWPRGLSGGMRMRVSLARALAIDPSLLLMDEPFGALDDLTRMRLDDELLALVRHQGLSVIFVTHNLAEAVYLADRVVVMSPRPGKITATFPVAAVRRDDDFRASAAFGALVKQLHAALSAAERQGQA